MDVLVYNFHCSPLIQSRCDTTDTRPASSNLYFANVAETVRWGESWEGMILCAIGWEYPSSSQTSLILHGMEGGGSRERDRPLPLSLLDLIPHLLFSTFRAGESLTRHSHTADNVALSRTSAKIMRSRLQFCHGMIRWFIALVGLTIGNSYSILFQPLPPSKALNPFILWRAVSQSFFTTRVTCFLVLVVVR